MCHKCFFRVVSRLGDGWLWYALILALPFTLSVMASRVVLGLHYPSDVAAGAVIGVVFGLIGHLLFGVL